MNEIGVKTVGQLKNLPTSQLLNVCGIKKFVDISTKALPGECPHKLIDYTQYDNPYEAKYGSSWKEDIKKVKSMRRICCITDMIMHIVVKSSQIFKGTTNKNNWVFYHDTLNLMTSKSTMKWMEKRIQWNFE